MTFDPSGERRTEFVKVRVRMGTSSPLKQCLGLSLVLGNTLQGTRRNNPGTVQSVEKILTCAV